MEKPSTPCILQLAYKMLQADKIKSMKFIYKQH